MSMAAHRCDHSRYYSECSLAHFEGMVMPIFTRDSPQECIARHTQSHQGAG